MWSCSRKADAALPAHPFVPAHPWARFLPGMGTATTDAFELLRYIAAKRLAGGRLTVVDATNVQQGAAARLAAACLAGAPLAAACLAAACLASACGAAMGESAKGSAGSEQMSQLWVEPKDIASRDMFYGPGGQSLVPKTDVDYRFRELDTKGHSRGYEVEDPEGRRWKVKVGDEAQPEIVVSRILWAIGYHQPATYYVQKWSMTGGPPSATAKRSTEPERTSKQTPEPGRFRLESGHKKVGNWSWSDNPFVGTRQYRGLLIANFLVNNWDLTTSNNRIYRIKEPREGPDVWYVVQDVGGSLGKTGLPVGSRNNVKDFESQDFVKGVESGYVKFDHHSRHLSLVKGITPDDVVWTCALLAKLTDRQLHDAFRAAGYSDDVTERFIRKIKTKIQQGLALDPHLQHAGPGGR